ncbi:hypothetical protein H0H87_003986 [Tephrocybe sp. NHM501043]|nr:hypothetical protein H0H87_003986 [Tephrocybe sp. NHM501043]
MIYQSLNPHPPSPIQRLPVELLSYIFTLGTLSLEGDEDPSVPSIDIETIKTPLAFSRVNHHWRNVAHKTPSLWTSICVTAGLVGPGNGWGHPSDATRFNARHLDTYLALSRNYPLDILIDARDQDWDFSEPEISSEYECSSYTPPFSSDEAPYPHNPLPRLRNLTLRGVHADWSALATILSQSDFGLDSLDLSSHCMDVRPTSCEYRQLLSQCPNLTKLVVDGSGPQIIDEGVDNSLTDKETQPILLPRLRDITIGYRSVHEGRAVLEAMDAPNVGDLTLVDGTHPGDVDDVDAGPLLAYIATSNIPPQDSQVPLSASMAPDGGIVPVEKDGFGNYLPRASFTEILPNSSPTSKALFPQLQRAQLRGVKSSMSNMYAMFVALSKLRHLEFSSMSMQALHALFPQTMISDSAGCATITCPCPELQSVCIRKSDDAHLQDSFRLIGTLAHERLFEGGSRLHEVDMHIDNTDGFATEDVIHLPNIGTTVTIVREAHEDEEDIMDRDVESGVDPFEVGGAFNDPIFDAQYPSGVLSY